MLWEISPEIRIDSAELDFSFARSSGPGGQNVNKVNSKAILRWNLLTSPSLAGEVRARLAARLETRISADGVIVITSDSYRDQPRNRESCLEKLRELLLAAARVPKTRKKSRPSKGSERRLKDAKSRHSRKKLLRKAPRE